MKIVTKPWGQEIWLAYPPELPYVMKKIFTKAGSRSSLHKHKKKNETNYIIEGKVNVYIEDPSLPQSDIAEYIYIAGEIFSIGPNIIHRVTAIEDTTTIEVSTPEVDDVIRLQDDTGRGDGRIESEHE